MLKNQDEIFVLKEMTLQDKHLLPEETKAIYFVTMTRGEEKEIIFISSAKDLRKKWKNHPRKLEFEFLNRMGSEVKISWLVLPNQTKLHEQDAVTNCYVRAFQPKLNCTENTFRSIEYDQLKKLAKDWEQAGDSTDTIIWNVWKLCRKYSL